MFRHIAARTILVHAARYLTALGYRSAASRRNFSFTIRTHTECMHGRPRVSTAFPSVQGRVTSGSLLIGAAESWPTIICARALLAPVAFNMVTRERRKLWNVTSLTCRLALRPAPAEAW